MSALWQCCQAEEGEACNCNIVSVRSTTEQLLNIEKGCNCMLTSADSYTSDKTEYIIEAHASAANKRPQIDKRSSWDELEREIQKYRNPKIPGIFCFYINVSFYRNFSTVPIAEILSGKNARAWPMGINSFHIK